VIWFYFIGRKKYKIVKSNFLLYENFVANIYTHTHTGNRVQEIKLQPIKDLIIILKNYYAYNIL
jgi:hypothetical protein